MTNATEGPTYIAISRYSNGDTYIDETKLNSSLQDAIQDIEHTHQVVLLEGGRAIDCSVDAAELWWALHGHTCDTTFDVPQFIHDQISSQVYSEIAASRAEAGSYRAHTTSGQRCVS